MTSKFNETLISTLAVKKTHRVKTLSQRRWHSKYVTMRFRFKSKEFSSIFHRCLLRNNSLSLCLSFYVRVGVKMIKTGTISCFFFTFYRPTARAWSTISMERAIKIRNGCAMTWNGWTQKEQRVKVTEAKKKPKTQKQNTPSHWKLSDLFANLQLPAFTVLQQCCLIVPDSDRRGEACRKKETNYFYLSGRFWCHLHVLYAGALPSRSFWLEESFQTRLLVFIFSIWAFLCMQLKIANCKLFLSKVFVTIVVLKTKDC